ncbi:sugar transporter [Amaricoccus tamworthensis]|uniref:sugar transporter n=1 Tax=Amaricoccus tamworthensis TaxID=57002 RepID=UPI003C7AD763
MTPPSDSRPAPAAQDGAADATTEPVDAEHTAEAGDAENSPQTSAKSKPRRRRRRKRRRKTAHQQEAAAETPAQAAPRPRHRVAMASFVLVVLAPFLVAVWYLFTRAADQYHSDMAFSIRSEESSAASAGLLGALTQIGGGTASDADILFEFIRSPEIVREIDAEIDLRAIYNRAENDPFFTLGDDPSIEALQAHWERMLDVSLNSAAGIVQVQARAFTPEDARLIASTVLEHSSDLVNRLAQQAREDAVRFAREELAEAEETLRQYRQDLTDFRRQYNIVDPTADVAGQVGLLSALQEQLAAALVDRDVILSYAAESDQRVIQANRRITAITEQIEEERSSLDLTGLPGSLPDVVGRYEELRVNLEFANAAFTQTLAGLAAARAEARRQSRYLAAHVEPTLAESSLYPRRFVLSGLTGLFLLMGWSIFLLIFYNVRDNR